MISILGGNGHCRTSATRKSMLSSLFRRAFALAVAIATGSSSIAITRFAPKRAAANARIPVPVPRSSNVLSGSGERRLPACWVRLPAEPSLKSVHRQAADERRLAACAPQNRVHRSSKRNDIAVVACSPVPKAAPAGMSNPLFLFLLRFLLATGR